MISQSQICPIQVPAAVATGAAVECGHWSRKTVYVDFAGGTLTTQVQISPNGTNWFVKGAALTASGFVDVPEACTHVRLNTTAFTSGVPVGVVCGY